MDTESGAIKFHGNCKINIPIAYALLGNREKALELVRRAAKGYSDPKFKCREMADEYLYAARNFLKHFFPEEKELLLVSRPTVAAQQTVKDEKEPEA
ncbi:MAG: hypothetical protein M5U26_27110 [Planctomycetota bacterium]|nr:hypothetical protein [Planctomycetota bacterium]